MAIVPPALGLFETGSIARGMLATDALVKKAPVHIHGAHPISPGHFLVTFSGGVAEVEECMAEALAIAGDTAIDHVFLPQVHDALPAALDGRFASVKGADPSVAIVETYTVSASILGADAACKAALVELVQLRLGQGLGGKGFFVLLGELYDVEAGVEAATAAMAAKSLQRAEIVPRPHPEFLAIYE